MAILLNGGTTVSVNEATNGIQLGILTGGTGSYEIYYSEDFYTGLFKTDTKNSQLIDGNILALHDDWYFDFETKYYTKHLATQQNGYISDFSTNSWTPTSQGVSPTVRIKSGTENQTFTINIVNKDETIIITTPTPLIQGRYGAVIAQVNPTDNYFNNVYFHGPSIFEIIGSN